MLVAAAADPFQTLYLNETRVATIAYRLQNNGGELCPDKMPLAGFVLHDRAQYPLAIRPALAERFGLESRPAVMVVVAGSPADRAGVTEGQSIFGIGSAGVEETPEGASGYGPLARVEALLDASNGEIAITAKAGGARIVSNFRPERGCRSRVQIIPGNKRNAHADGFYVQLTHAMIAETANDDELAFVIAHEMAHNILGHRAKLGQRRKRAQIRTAESEADSLGIRLMHAARYDVEAAPAFWAKFGAKTGYGIFSDGTHLRTKARVRLLREAAAQTRAAQPEARAQ